MPAPSLRPPAPIPPRPLRTPAITHLPTAPRMDPDAMRQNATRRTILRPHPDLRNEPPRTTPQRLLRPVATLCIPRRPPQNEPTPRFPLTPTPTPP